MSNGDDNSISTPIPHGYEIEMDEKIPSKLSYRFKKRYKYMLAGLKESAKYVLCYTVTSSAMLVALAPATKQMLPRHGSELLQLVR